MQDKVARLRQLMREAVPRNAPESLEQQAHHAFAVYSLNVPSPPAVVQTHRARMERDIARIAAWYGWSGEIVRALDAAHAHSVTALSDDQVEQLASRLRQLESCAQNGLDAPDTPPAR